MWWFNAIFKENIWIINGEFVMGVALTVIKLSLRLLFIKVAAAEKWLDFWICSLSLWLTGNWQEKLELWWELVFGVESVGEIDSSDSAVSVDLNSKGLYVVGTVSSSGEIRQIELNLIPSLIKSHRHGANERLDSGGRLIVRGSESSSYALVIEYLHLEGEVLLQVLNDHDQERKLNGQGLLWVKRGVNVVGRHIGSHDLENWRLNIRISDSLNVTVSDLLIPNLEGLGSIVKIWLEYVLKVSTSKREALSASCLPSWSLYELDNLPNRIKNGKETALIGGLKHFKFLKFNLWLKYSIFYL